MSHEIDMSNDRANVAYIGDKPWHGLGTVMQPDQTLDEWRIAAGLDWEIKTAPVIFQPPSSTAYFYPEQQFPDRSVLYRSDTRTPLSIMSSSRYHIVQPAEIFKFYKDLVDDSRYTLETAGALFGGKRIWCLARSNVQIKIGNQDILKPYLLLSTSCDGTMSTVADLTSVRVVCNNTLSMAVGSDGKGAQIRVPHSAKLNHDEIKRDLGLLDDRVESFANDCDLLSGVKVNDERAVNYFVELYAKKDDNGNLTNAPSVERTVNKLMALYKNGPGAQYETATGTGWGLVNAVTRYQDFDSRSRSNENRFSSSQYGNGKNVKAKAFADALAIAA